MHTDPRRDQRRHRLAPLHALWLLALCSGFTWPGRVAHYTYQAAHGTPEVRVTALRWLEQYPSEATAQAMLSALEDPDPDVRAQAADSLGHMGVATAVAPLFSWLTSREAPTRARAVRALGGLGDARALPGLRHALHDAAPEVRVAAVAALAQLSEPSEIAADLLEALDDGEPEVRVAAIRALDRPGVPNSAQTVTKLSARSSDPTPEVRVASLRALGHMRDARALSALARAQSERDPDVKLAALAALGDSGLAGAVAPLRALLQGDTSEARMALAALGRIDDAQALTALASKLAQPELARASSAALLDRARRLSEAATWDKTRNVLAEALAQSRSDAHATALARALCELAPFSDLGPAQATLIEALQSGRAELDALVCPLLALRSRELASTLISRLDTADAQATGRIADALERTLRTLEVDAGVSARLAERLANADPARRARILTLLALAGHDGPWAGPAVAAGAQSAHDGERRATADLLGALPPAIERRQQLLELLADPVASVREHAINAIADTADLATIDALVERLTQPTPLHETSLLAALAGALARARTSAPLAKPLRDRLFAVLAGARLESADPKIAAGTLVALRSFDDPRTAPLVARLLRTGSGQRRAAAVLALADFKLPETRRLLRYVLQNDTPQLALNAALALAEVGTERDAEALLRASERGTWPLPAAAGFALARIAQRGVVKKHVLSGVLCRLGRSSDPYVRANVAAGLAALSVPACDRGPSPSDWLAAHAPSAQRAAAARWLALAPAADAEAERARAQALARCAADPDESVARACRQPSTDQPARGTLLARALDADTPLIGRVLALRLPDGTVFVGPSDANGQIMLPGVPEGEVLLEDPADFSPLPAVAESNPPSALSPAASLPRFSSSSPAAAAEAWLPFPAGPSAARAGRR